MSKKRICIETSDIETDKPQGGGGKGTDRLYIVTVVIDGEPALQLNAWNFKKPGQMEKFSGLMKELTK